MNEVEKYLKDNGVSPTAVRVLVFRCLRDSRFPMSLSDIESSLETVDKSTISRTLNTFKNHNLIHSFTDGTGSLKFEISNFSNQKKEVDRHVHFRCEKCGITMCLNTLSIPKVELPEGFVERESNYVITGICKNCN